MEEAAEDETEIEMEEEEEEDDDKDKKKKSKKRMKIKRISTKLIKRLENVNVKHVLKNFKSFVSVVSY